MGDSLINLAINLRDNNSNIKDKGSSPTYKKYRKQFAADSALIEVVNWIVESCRRDSSHSQRAIIGEKDLAIFDCTVHPVKRVEIVSGENDLFVGSGAVTLHAMGWFPSGKLCVVFADDLIAQRNAMSHDIPEDSRMLGKKTIDHENADVNNNSVVKLISVEDGSFRPMPSEVLESVEHRFDAENVAAVTSLANRSSNTAAQIQRKRQLESERFARLDATIRALDEKLLAAKNKKSSNVSAQVKRMLIKSQSKGEKSLNIRDRFYLEIVTVEDDFNDTAFDALCGGSSPSSPATSSFHFFSRMAMVGSVISTCYSDNKHSPQQRSELIIKKDVKKQMSVGGPAVYCRLPNTLALYEAEDSGYLQQFQRVIIRRFNEKGAPSQSILGSSDEKNTLNEHNDIDAITHDDGGDADDSRECAQICAQSDGHNMHVFQEEIDICARIDGLINNFDRHEAKQKVGKKTSAKMHQIIMKSKAKGDKKIPASERFFLECMVIDDTDPSCASVSSSLLFFPKAATLGRICLKLFPDNLGENVQCLIKGSANADSSNIYCYLPTSLKLCDAEVKGYISQLGRILVRKFDGNKSASLALSVAIENAVTRC